MSNSNRANTLTMLTMLVTITVSIGGTWITNLINIGVNESRIASLIEDNRITKVANTLVYQLETEVKSIKSEQSTVWNAMHDLNDKVDVVEETSARSSQAIENLVNATQQLTETNKQLIVAVAKLER